MKYASCLVMTIIILLLTSKSTLIQNVVTQTRWRVGRMPEQCNCACHDNSSWRARTTTHVFHWRCGGSPVGISYMRTCTKPVYKAANNAELKKCMPVKLKIGREYNSSITLPFHCYYNNIYIYKFISLNYLQMSLFLLAVDIVLIRPCPGSPALG